MDTQERNKLIETYGRGYDELVTALEAIPQEAWHFRPAPQEWSVHQVIIHLAESETNAALRARLLITEPGRALMAYDQELWAEAMDYPSQDWQLALEGVKWARGSTYALLKKLPEDAWKNTVEHTEFDQPYGFELWLQIYAGHIPGHIEQINNNYKLWQESQ